MDDFEPDMQSERHPTDQEHDFSYPRSVVVGVFLLSIFVLVLVGIQLKQRFTLQIPTFGNGSDLVSNVRQSLLDASDEELKKQDSDQDGLTDYQELRIYGTNPFIADSDSDGISDAAEVAAGTDPNCPEGQNCFVGPTDVKQNNTAVQTSIAPLLNSPQDIRKLLLDQGADPTLVNQLDDQTLQAMAQQALDVYQNPQQQNLKTLSQLQPEQIRQLLIANGIDAQALSQYSDQDLLDLYQSVLTDVSATSGSSASAPSDGSSSTTTPGQ